MKNSHCFSIHYSTSLQRIKNRRHFNEQKIDYLNTEDKKNKKFNSTENLCNCEEEANILKGNNIASQLGARLEGKFGRKNVTNL